MTSISHRMQQIAPAAFLLCALVRMPVSSVAQQIASTAAASSTTASAPAAPIAAASTDSTTSQAASYVVGEADVLRVNVWKQPELSQANVRVRPDGMVSLPLIGDVKVSGMTPVQIEARLVAGLKSYVNEPRVTVAVIEVASKMVYVTGEIARPGAYPLVGPVDILQLIAKAGGVTPYAHRKSMFVLRQVEGSKQKLSVNYNQIIRGKSPEQNINLQPGDTVVVP